jgi:hypothetical protein
MTPSLLPRAARHPRDRDDTVSTRNSEGSRQISVLMASVRVCLCVRIIQHEELAARGGVVLYSRRAYLARLDG